MTTNPDSPAFPELHIHHFMTDAEGKEKPAIVPRWHGGLSKREWFAGEAMAGLCSNPEAVWSAEVLTKSALCYADALILALNQKPTEGK